jgi:CheY-like chemotaxis protein
MKLIEIVLSSNTNSNESLAEINSNKSINVMSKTSILFKLSICNIEKEITTILKCIVDRKKLINNVEWNINKSFIDSKVYIYLDVITFILNITIDYLCLKWETVKLSIDFASLTEENLNYNNIISKFEENNLMKNEFEATEFGYVQISIECFEPFNLSDEILDNKEFYNVENNLILNFMLNNIHGVFSSFSHSTQMGNDESSSFEICIPCCFFHNDCVSNTNTVDSTVENESRTETNKSSASMFKSQIFSNFGFNSLTLNKNKKKVLPEPQQSNSLRTDMNNNNSNNNNESYLLSNSPCSARLNYTMAAQENVANEYCNIEASNDTNVKNCIVEKKNSQPFFIPFKLNFFYSSSKVFPGNENNTVQSSINNHISEKNNINNNMNDAGKYEGNLKAPIPKLIIKSNIEQIKNNKNNLPDESEQETEIKKDNLQVAETAPTIVDKKLKVLVIEDTILVQKMLTRWLTSNGCVVTCADNGKIGLDFLKKENFDLVLCDFLMVRFLSI